ncbi:baseplate J/gp47 family protein [Paraburkholderia diazotrophica]|uniref:Phage-related baseplate assembly protein n=1 Tax=Paraburkholderia diazotrophica TaxID=667676 RepID=A0A1H7EGF4_9BURK|nr:baseplate J/gp47 family protein [Paraburkholderia diazotrophica]SEK13043.1 Phage-related baseplate assembly protein [Paraburkholderia diazotrophica]
MSATPIDLSRLSSPDIVETIDYETLLAERKAALVALYPADKQAEVAAALALESEPMNIHLQENAYREVVLRQRVNDAARSIMLAYAKGTTLEHLAALFEIERLTITPADPANDIDAVYENDTDLRARTQLAPQGFSVAGPEGAYISHARNADGRVLDASAVSPAPCEVVVTVLSREGDGTADETLVDKVKAALAADNVRPLTDFVDVRSATIKRYAVRATLVFFAGPDRAVALAEANKRVKAYTEEMHKLGMAITLDGVYAAARAPGVQKVLLTEPAADIPATKQEAPYCTAIELVDGGIYNNE